MIHILGVLSLLVMVSSCFPVCSTCVQLMMVSFSALFLLCFFSSLFFCSLFCSMYRWRSVFSPPPANQRVSSRDLSRLESLAFIWQLNANILLHIEPALDILLSLIVFYRKTRTFTVHSSKWLFFSFIPEGRSSSNNNDGEAFQTGRLPKPWRRVSHLKVVFRFLCGTDGGPAPGPCFMDNN